MRDIYAEITNGIIKSIEDNPGKVILPWQRNGSSGLPVNIDTDATYRGVNIVMLWFTIEDHNYSSNTFGTYKQWQKKGCQVRNGEKASPIIFYKELFVEEDGKQKKIPMLRSSTVFNADQVEGYDPPEVEDHGPIERIKEADGLVTRTKATIVHGGPSAYYHRKRDDITMPDEQRFFDTKTATRTENYYSTLFHELTHWSGAEHRLAREKGKRFGDDKYAFEELVAELGAAFLCAKLTIEKEPRPDHADYIANWLGALKGDKKFIFTASARAQDAVDYLCKGVIEWCGISVEISHVPDWPGHGYQHIELRATQMLPVTETGYRSHYIHNDEIDLFESAEAFVIEWLDEYAKDPKWLQHVEASKQLNLFPD